MRLRFVVVFGFDGIDSELLVGYDSAAEWSLLRSGVLFSLNCLLLVGPAAEHDALVVVDDICMDGGVLLEGSYAMFVSFILFISQY